MNTEQPSAEQILVFHAERQTSAIEKIRDYVFYLLLMTSIALIVGFVAAFSSTRF